MNEKVHNRNFVLHLIVWSASTKVRETTMKLQRDFVHKLFTFPYFGFRRAAPIPYIQVAVLTYPVPT